MAKVSKIINEKFYQDQWEQNKIYAYQEASSKARFVIDTPPPTISGALHIGHVFSYTQTDIIARFQRMQGKNVFYPMGWDNNGLPTEKRVQKLHRIFCDPVAGTFKLVENKKKSLRLVSREEFITLCRKQTQEDQKQYEALWRRLALSVDWNQKYETISDFSRMHAQRSFLDLYQKSLVENRMSLVFWDTQFQTAVAQADIEDRTEQGSYYNIAFQVREQKNPLVIATTRPELLAACIAVVAHPEDTRYQNLFGKYAVTALFGAVVPILSSKHADPKKGTGILMICTFGDKEDWNFWLKLRKIDMGKNISDEELMQRHPQIKSVIAPNGKMLPVTFKESSTENFASLNPKQANNFYSELKDLSVKQARRKTVELLKLSGALKKEIPCEHTVKYYEKGDLPLELMLTRQWYIKLLEHKEDFLKRGREIKWHPPAMRKRYEDWVEGLNQDWCISRQRFFGVPFPLWYPLNENKEPDYQHPILAPMGQTIDPITKAPADFSSIDNKGHSQEFLKRCTEENRAKAKGFIADTNVMDTWAVSSLTPQLNSHWGVNSLRHQQLFPADLRWQAHEIIRTWAFYTIVKSHFHANRVPWRCIAVSGWVMNPDRAKLSKSKGMRILDPQALMDQYGVDAIRYWAGKSRLGQDTVYDENTIKSGQRLTVKLLNAFRFMEIQVAKRKWQGIKDSTLEVVDKAWVLYLYHSGEQATNFLQKFEYAAALDEIERVFWEFCDHYVELVKARAYRLKDQAEGKSAINTLDWSLYFFIKSLAPFLPYVTEHLWSLRYKVEKSSVHESNWFFIQPSTATLWQKEKSASQQLCQFIFNALEQIRSHKSKKQKSLSVAIQYLCIELSFVSQALWNKSKADIARAANVELKHIHTNIISDSSKEKHLHFKILKIEFA